MTKKINIKGLKEYLCIDPEVGENLIYAYPKELTPQQRVLLNNHLKVCQKCKEEIRFRVWVRKSVKQYGIEAFGKQKVFQSLLPEGNLTDVDMINIVKKLLGLPTHKVKEAISYLFGAIMTALANGRNVSIRSFGQFISTLPKFEVAKTGYLHGARKSKVIRKEIVSFKPSKKFKKMITSPKIETIHK